MNTDNKNRNIQGYMLYYRTRGKPMSPITCPSLGLPYFDPCLALLLQLLLYSGSMKLKEKGCFK